MTKTMAGPVKFTIRISVMLVALDKTPYESDIIE
jgi:hypothetical protein